MVDVSNRNSSKLHFVLLCFLALPFCSSSQARAESETLSFGFPEFNAELNLLKDPHPAAQFVRRAAFGALTTKVSSAAGSSFKLDLADQISSSSDLLSWDFRIPVEQKFSNGRPILIGDVISSLKNCHAEGKLPSVQKISQSPKPFESSGSWVRLELSAQDSQNASKQLPLSLAECPIFNDELRALFGEDFGIGSNLVSAAKYQIESFKGENELVLSKVQVGRAMQRGAARIVLRGVKDGAQALSALRSGNLDGFCTASKELVLKAQPDITLSALPCDGYTFIFRKGLRFSCDNSISAQDFGYQS